MKNATISERSAIGATLYARADRSDPFAFNRAMSHIRNGIATQELNANKQPMCYGADAYQEPREYIGTDGKPVAYAVPQFRNVHRP